MMRFLIFVSLLMGAGQSFAAITMGTVTNASATNLTLTPPVIYGGIAGTACSGTGDATCDNCAADLKACNRNRIYPSLSLRIEFTSSTSAGVPKLLTGTTATEVDISSNQGTCAKGSTCYIEVDWSKICDLDDGTNQCAESETHSLTIGVSSGNNTTLEDSKVIAINVSSIGDSADEIDLCTSATPPSEGICNWYVYPGDEKVYMREPIPSNDSFPTAPDGSIQEITGVRVFYSKVGFSSIFANSGEYTDLGIEAGEESGDSELTNRVIDGLENQVPYFFRLASIDAAGNQGYMTSDTAIDDNGDCDSAQVVATYDADCRFSAMPDKVFGLLTEDLNCFISTAAFGSSFDKHVQTFRDFRNRFLLTNSPGKKFVLKYYEYGPKAAMWLHNNPEFKPLARAALWPMYAFAWLSLKLEAILFPTAEAQELPTEESFFEEQNKTKSNQQTAPAPTARRKTNNPEAEAKPAPVTDTFPKFAPANPRGYSEAPKRQFVPHPLAEKGLIKIQRDGVYRYKVERSPQKKSSSFRIGMFTPKELRNSDTDPNIYYTDIYENDQSPILFFDWQYYFFKKFGKMSVKLETGLLVSQGNGRFENTPSKEALELFTFAGFPSSVGLAYRAQFWDAQPIVPYVEGGGLAVPFAEFRDDGKAPKLGAGYGAFFSAGAALNLSIFDMDLLYEMDREYGINSTWFEVEARQQISASRFDFSGTIIAAGFHFEF